MNEEAIEEQDGHFSAMRSEAGHGVSYLAPSAGRCLTFRKKPA